MEYEGGMPAPISRTPRLSITTFDEFAQHEGEILKRINALSNGPKLFLVHPFALLEDLGVELSEQTKQEIIVMEPRLRTLSLLPYKALKASGARSPSRARLQGLFKKGGDA
jgi:hypothetical protein